VIVCVCVWLGVVNVSPQWKGRVVYSGVLPMKLVIARLVCAKLLGDPLRIEPQMK
jgi:hypothetical protein